MLQSSQMLQSSLLYMVLREACLLKSFCQLNKFFCNEIAKIQLQLHSMYVFIPAHVRMAQEAFNIKIKTVKHKKFLHPPAILYSRLSVHKMTILEFTSTIVDQPPTPPPWGEHCQRFIFLYLESSTFNQV